VKQFSDCHEYRRRSRVLYEEIFTRDFAKNMKKGRKMGVEKCTSTRGGTGERRIEIPQEMIIHRKKSSV